jgi:hypothetical protein
MRRFVPALQALAKGMAPSFKQQMKRLIDDAMTYFLPGLALADPVHGVEAPTPSPVSCKGAQGTTEEDPRDQGSSPAGGADARCPVMGLNPDVSKASVPESDFSWLDAASLLKGGSVAAGSSEGPGPQGTALGIVPGPAKSSECPPGSGLSNCSHAEAGGVPGPEGIKAEEEGQEKITGDRVRKGVLEIEPADKIGNGVAKENAMLSRSISLTSRQEGPEQDPIRLTFKDPALENRFKIRRAMYCMRVRYARAAETAVPPYFLFVFMLSTGVQKLSL